MLPAPALKGRKPAMRFRRGKPSKATGKLPRGILGKIVANDKKKNLAEMKLAFFELKEQQLQEATQAVRGTQQAAGDLAAKLNEMHEVVKEKNLVAAEVTDLNQRAAELSEAATKQTEMLNARAEARAAERMKKREERLRREMEREWNMAENERRARAMMRLVRRLQGRE